MEESHSRIGIVGYWYATNYGSVMTYYALYRTIEGLGYEPMLIDIPEKEKDPEGEGVFSRIFLRDHCRISESVKWDEISRLNDMCDGFVVGSDQVWTRDALRISRYMFFLNFVEGDRKRIAYAPSFGNSRVDFASDERANIRKCLRAFDRISIREDAGREFVRKELHIDCDQVLDPVFLMSTEDYDAIASESNADTDGGYLLAYILDPTLDKEEVVAKVAGKLGLKVKMVLDGRFGTSAKNKSKLKRYADDVIEDVSESCWVKLFRDASYVVTDSHHGLAMSIIYSKPVIAYANHSRGYSRFISLLNLLGIPKILIESSEAIGDSLEPFAIDYGAVSEVIARERDGSVEWLRGGLYTRSPRNSVEFTVDIYEQCCGCSSCFNACPKRAITMVPNGEGFLNPSVDPSKCTDCGTCSKRCPELNPRFDNFANPKCYAAWASDDIRSVSSSGGMFSVAAQAVLEEGGAVCGAVFRNDWSVEHIIVEDEIGLSEIRGSKYIQSEIGDAYRRVKGMLKKGRPVLFTGMPCQVAGLHAYLGKDYDNLYTVDILCHGITSYKVFEKYRKEILDGKRITDIKFKAKKPWGWHAGVNAKFDDGSSYSVIIEKDPYYRAYISGLSRNTTCGTCVFERTPRQGDLTIGDFWKIQDFDPSLNDNKGTSLVLVNSARGEELFEMMGPKLQRCVEVPIVYGIAGNGIIKFPYKLHPNRNLFFRDMDSMPYGELLDRYEGKRKGIAGHEKNMNRSNRDIYAIADLVARNCNGRKVILWGDSPELRKVLVEECGLSTPFIVTSDRKNYDGRWVHMLDELKGRNKEFYLVAFGRAYDAHYSEAIKSYGFEEIEDYVYRVIKPVVLEDFDLSKGPYTDAYGNRVEGSKGVVKRIVLRGYCNHIKIAGNVFGLQNLQFDLTAKTYVEIGPWTNFTQNETVINTQGYVGFAAVMIGSACRFMRSSLRMFLNPHGSTITIGDKCTFGDNLDMHANSGKKIIFGKDCMLSKEITMWAGDGHSLFDVKTGMNVNSVYETQSLYRNQIVIGDHVWIGDGAFIIHGTNIGSGSVIGAKSVVKKRCHNNVTLAGNPAVQIKTDVAWCYGMNVINISQCEEYARLTDDTNPPLSGAEVLVLGGNKQNGRALVEELLRRGNVITLGNRGRNPDPFGDKVDRLILDVSKPESVKNALSGRYFDAVFNNIAYSSNSVKNVLSNVKCGKYVQLSTIGVYFSQRMDQQESDFNPRNAKLKWVNADVGYGYGKQQAECAVFQQFDKVPAIAVRIPYVVPTDRLSYYCDCIVNGEPMAIGDVERRMTFVRCSELGKFMVWAVNQDFSGVVNFGSSGSVSVGDIVGYIERKTGCKATISKDGKAAPFENNDSFSLNLDVVNGMGYKTSSVDDWIWGAIDYYINEATKRKKSEGKQ